MQEKAPRFLAMRVCFALCQRGWVIFMILRHWRFLQVCAVLHFCYLWDCLWKRMSSGKMSVKTCLWSSFTLLSPQFPFLAFYCLVQDEGQTHCSTFTLIMSKPALFRFLVHVLCSMFTITQADDGAGFSSFPPMAQQFLCTVHSLLFTVKTKIIKKKQTLPPSFKWIPKGAGRQTTCRYFPRYPHQETKNSPIFNASATCI